MRMAALLGRLRGNRKEVTRLGSKGSGIQAKLETWEGSVESRLEANGDFTIRIGDKGHPGLTVLRGNVNDRPLTWDAIWSNNQKR